MAKIPPAQYRRQPASPRKIGLALAGGGPVGAIYELGALRALEDGIDGLDLTRLEVYVGVSAGCFAAAALANGINLRECYRVFIDSDAAEGGFTPELFLRPALAEYARRARALPPLLASALWRYLRGGRTRSRLLESFQPLTRALPAGLFDNRVLDAFLARWFSQPGRSNDFRQLGRRLFIVATELDTGEIAQFGAPGFDRVPVSTAIAASTALPGLFPPVVIGGRHYVDGALRRTLHASVALDTGASLVFCVNPLVPYDASLAPNDAHPRLARLADGGLPVVLSQTFRSLIHSRMQVGMAKYRRDYADADVVLFEPEKSDEEMFFTNVFSYAERERICEHAYQMTRRDLIARRRELDGILPRHGLKLNMKALRDPSLTASGRLAGARGRRARVASLGLHKQLEHALDDLQYYLEQRG